jgi:hypothetical protein
MGLRVPDARSAVAELTSRGVVFEEYAFPGLNAVDGIADIGGGPRRNRFKRRLGPNCSHRVLIGEHRCEHSGRARLASGTNRSSCRTIHQRPISANAVTA